MCKYCEKIYVRDESHNAFERARYKIEWSIPKKGFFTIEDDCEYEHRINYCPWCGRKLEAPEADFVPVLSDKELIAELLASRDKLEKRVERLDERLSQVCTNLYRFVDKRWWDEKQN